MRVHSKMDLVYILYSVQNRTEVVHRVIHALVHPYYTRKENNIYSPLKTLDYLKALAQKHNDEFNMEHGTFYVLTDYLEHGVVVPNYIDLPTVACEEDITFLNMDFDVKILSTMSLSESDMKEYNLKPSTEHTQCPLCHAEMEYSKVEINEHESHVWSCTECPNVMFEYSDNNDLLGLRHYLHDLNDNNFESLSEHEPTDEEETI